MMPRAIRVVGTSFFGHMAEIFVSYTSSDRDWAFWLGKELEDLGHSPHIHEWENKAATCVGAHHLSRRLKALGH
jgi:TIR domain